MGHPIAERADEVICSHAARVVASQCMMQTHISPPPIYPRGPQIGEREPAAFSGTEL